MSRLIFSFILLLFGTQLTANTLKQVRAHGQELDIITTQHVEARHFILNQPYRLVLDLNQTQVPSKLYYPRQLAFAQLRLAQFSSTVTRVVLQFDHRPNYRLQSSQDGEGHHLRLIYHPATTDTLLQQPIELSSPPIKASGQRRVVVVIDPGHGGKDPGAMGYHHTQEKQVVLAIARRLQQKINRQPGMMAVLTRDGDYFIDLRRRLDISRRYHPDLFVAIHADAFSNTASHGASVFALSQRGATSEAARWLAEKENYSELAGVNLKGLDDKNGMIRSVLIDLSQTATIQASLKIGTRVLNGLGRMTSLHNHHVEQARFVVLKSPDTPSILVETGFISNPNEERNLASPAYQEQLSQAIFLGIYQYFREYPPRGSSFK